MKLHLKRISPPSLSLTLAALYGIIGFIVGVLSLFGALTRFGVGAQASPVSQTIWEVLGMLVFQPVVSAVLGAVTGFVLAWLYNFVARFTKGVLVQLEEAGKYDD